MFFKKKNKGASMEDLMKVLYGENVTNHGKYTHDIVFDFDMALDNKDHSVVVVSGGSGSGGSMGPGGGGGFRYGVTLESMIACKTCGCLGYTKDFKKIVQHEISQVTGLKTVVELFYCLKCKPDYDKVEINGKDNKQYFKWIPQVDGHYEIIKSKWLKNK